jgi:quercetin dioxygenase-like cupin family protein
MSLDDLIEFDADRRVRKRLILSERIEAELVCYEPGQGTVEHHHVGQDEIFYVVEGRGTFEVDGEAIPVAPKSIVFAPAQAKHSIQCADDSRLVLPARAAEPKPSHAHRGNSLPLSAQATTRFLVQWCAIPPRS